MIAYINYGSNSSNTCNVMYPLNTGILTSIMFFLFSSNSIRTSVGYKLIQRTSSPLQYIGGYISRSNIMKCSMSTTSPEVELLMKSIAGKGDQIKSLKSEKPPTLKEDLAPLVNELLAMKLSYKELTGEDYGGGSPAAKTSKKSEAVAAVKETVSMEDLINLCKTRGFVFQSSGEHLCHRLYTKQPPQGSLRLTITILLLRRRAKRDIPVVSWFF